MKLQVLVDNNTYIDHYYLGEPGVSYYIEIDDCRILFDTGYSDVLIKNAKAMNIDLSAVTHIVLSHGHNDHSNGLYHLSRAFDLSNVQLITHPLCFNPKYESGESIGTPFSAQEMSALCRYRPTSAPYHISPNCVFLGQIKALNQFEDRLKIGTTLIDGDTVDDLNYDDSALVCKTSDGLLVVTGCSHSGICNIVEYAKQICDCSKIAAILGGFHLFHVNERLHKTIEYLKTVSPNMLYPCHCVSLKAKAEIMKVIPVEEVGVGMRIEL